MKKPIEIRENAKISSVYPVLVASPSEMVGIVDDNGRLKGTATKTSVTNKLVAGGNANEPIERAMYKEPLQIRDDKTLNEAMKMINEQSR
jgi:predicted transcriptional regulator